MYKVLNPEEVEKFTEKYFKIWKKDIWKVTKINYKNTSEYMINDHYIFTVKEGTK